MSIIRIGCFKSQKKVATHGTGFIINYLGEYFVVTCKHVILSCETQDYFMLVDTTNQPIPQDISKYIQINKPFYHYNDTESSSKDIAIFKIDGSLVTERRLGFYKLNKELSLSNDVCTTGVGYPKEYFNLNKMQGIFYLKPYIISCRYFKSNDISHLTQKGMPFKVSEIYGAVITMPTLNNLSGISGGPLLHNKDNSVVGLICSSGVDGIRNEHGEQVPYLGIVPTNRIIEVLDKRVK